MKPYRVQIDVEVNAENGEDALARTFLVAVKTYTSGDAETARDVFCSRGSARIDVEEIKNE